MVTQAPPVASSITENPAAPVVAEPVEATALVPVAEPLAPTEPPVTTVAPKPAETPALQTAPESPEVQAYQARLEEQLRTAQEKNDQRTLEEFTDKYAQGLAQEVVAIYGVTPEQALPFAQKIAKQQGEIARANYQAEQSRRGQLNAAFAIAQENGADQRTIAMVKAIMNLATPEAMRSAAKQATDQTAQAAELTRLRAENETLKKGRVPAQNFAGPGGAATQVADNSNIDALYMKWERENPNANKVNPYESQYRKFLYGA